MTNQPKFDVFLAHNSQDKSQVKAIAQKLMQRGLYYWIDEEQIPPGRPFQDVIQQAIPVVKSAAMFIGLEGLGKWQDWELRALQTQCVKTSIPLIPVLLPGVEEIPEHLLFLQELNWVRFATQIDDVEALNNLEWGITGERPNPKTAIANRTQELKFFLQMVRGQTSERILLLKAPSGFGKSSLLKKFSQRCPQEVGVLRRLDLKAAEIGLPYFFHHVCDDLGYDRFQEFTAELEKMLSGAENVSEYGSKWQRAIQSVLNVEQNLRQDRLDVLQQAFFRDLEAIGQTIVLLLDTFEAAVTELKDWINGELLNAVSRISRLIVVIAGQEVPNPKSSVWEDDCHYCCLEVIEDEESWYSFAQQVGMPFDKGAIKMLALALNGNPLAIRNQLDAIARRW
jgi:hypothetical protein